MRIVGVAPAEPGYPSSSQDVACHAGDETAGGLLEIAREKRLNRAIDIAPKESPNDRNGRIEAPA